MVASAVSIEPVSTDKLPANREKYRESVDFDPDLEICSHLTAINWALLAKFPVTCSREFLGMYQGYMSKKQGGTDDIAAVFVRASPTRIGSDF